MPVPEVVLSQETMNHIRQTMCNLHGGGLSSEDLANDFYAVMDDPEYWSNSVWSFFTQRPALGNTIWDSNHRNGGRSSLCYMQAFPFPVTGLSDWRKAIVKVRGRVTNANTESE